MRAVKLTEEQLEDLEEARALRLTVKESVTSVSRLARPGMGAAF